MTNTTIDGLIERLEKATGPDRELDRAIWAAKDGPGYEHRLTSSNQSDEYTASIDAALTLARHSVDVIVMLHAAFKAAQQEPTYPINLWPSIKAALLAALRARDPSGG